MTLGTQVLHLARRSVIRTLRQPANWITPLIFPLALMAVNSGGLQAATHLPGFPTDSFVAFFLAFPFIQGALFSTVNAGVDLARDIQTGFLNRLALTPMQSTALLVGHLHAKAAHDRRVDDRVDRDGRAVALREGRRQALDLHRAQRDGGEHRRHHATALVGDARNAFRNTTAAAPVPWKCGTRSK